MLRLLTQIHVAISLIGIVSGLVVVVGLLTARRLDGWTALFLASTVATSLTGFLFPFNGFTPAIGVGIISLALLVVAIFARYSKRLVRGWRWIYVVTAMFSLYLNVFVLIVQLYQKVASLKALAPTQTEAPFIATQVVTLLLFLLLTILAVLKFHPGPSQS
jgi:hypothetical protein